MHDNPARLLDLEELVEGVVRKSLKSSVTHARGAQVEVTAVQTLVAYASNGHLAGITHNPFVNRIRRVGDLVEFVACGVLGPNAGVVQTPRAIIEV
jgi:hypothetical protein